jgi:hypothetical protein
MVGLYAVPPAGAGGPCTVCRAMGGGVQRPTVVARAGGRRAKRDERPGHARRVGAKTTTAHRRANPTPPKPLNAVRTAPCQILQLLE